MLLINVCLLIFALTGSLAAFSGETWDNKKPRLYNKITKLGWVAISCLLLAFIFGFLKEVIQHKASIVSELKKMNFKKI